MIRSHACRILCLLALAGCDAATAPDASRGVSLSAHGGMAAQATGSGHLTAGGELRTFAFTARQRTNGTVTGQFQILNRAQDRRAHGEVLCMRVVGNRAQIGGRVTRSDDPALVGAHGIFEVVDNGEGAGAPPDQTTLFSVASPATVSTYCASDFPGALPLHPIEGGNIQVR